MNHSKKIVAMLLLAICLMGILPITVYAVDDFDLESIYFFNNDGVRSTYESLLIGRFELGGVFNQLHLDIDVVGTGISIVYSPSEFGDSGLDLSIVLTGRGLVQNQNGIPIYYPHIGVAVTSDSYALLPRIDRLLVTIYDIAEEEPVQLYNHWLEIDTFNIRVLDINYEESMNLPFLASWFTKDGDPWENSVDNILIGWTNLSDVFIGSIGDVYSQLNIISVVAIIIMSTAMVLCLVILIKRLFERR